jgi:phage shock protein PspC (stress-responsive transcriptional regulator)
VLGGVCAGIARSAGLDPLLLRIAVVAVTVLTGGAGVPAYLAAWVLIPREPLDAAPGEPAAPPVGASGADARAAWIAAGNDLRSLTTELRRPAPGTDPAAATDGETQTESGAPAAPPGAIPPPRSPLVAADDAATALGDRLRTPEVQAGARKAAAGVSEAVTASVEELARRVRRDRS